MGTFYLEAQGLDSTIVYHVKGQRQRSRPKAALNTACIVPPVISSQQMRYHPILVFRRPISSASWCYATARLIQWRGNCSSVLASVGRI